MPSGTPGFAVAAVLTACALFICFRIELLNARAGWRLPSRELHSETGRPVRWRYDVATTPDRWRQLRGPRDESGKPVERTLKPEERARMDADLAKAQSSNALLAFVQTWGLAQYPVLTAAVLLALASTLSRRRAVSVRIASGCLVLIQTPAVVLLVYRAHFTSLGW